MLLDRQAIAGCEERCYSSVVPMWFAHVGCRYGPRLPVFGVTTTFSVISWRVVSDGSVLRAFAGLLPLLTGNWALCGSVDDVFSSRGLYLPWRYRYLPLDHELVGRIPSGELAALPTAFAAWPKGNMGAARGLHPRDVSKAMNRMIHGVNTNS